MLNPWFGIVSAYEFFGYQSRSKVEELEEIAAMVSGGGGLENHLEAAADLHRAVALLWEGVGDALNALPGDETQSSDIGDNDAAGGVTSRRESSPEAVLPQENQAETLSRDASSGGGANNALVASSATDAASAAAGEADLSAAAGEHAAVVFGMLRDQEFLDIPMHLEDSALPIVTTALSVDAGRVQAAAKFLLAGMLAALSAARAAATAAAGAAAAARAASLQLRSDQTGDTLRPRECPPTAATPPLLVTAAAGPPAPVPLRQALPLDDDETRSGSSGSDRQSSEGVPSDGGEEVEGETASAASDGGGSSSEEADEEGGVYTDFEASGGGWWC